MAATQYSFTKEDLPQDPFLPQIAPRGPVLLDSEACYCALRGNPEADSNDNVWQCVGNQTKAYSTDDGKWFPSSASGKVTDLNIDDGSAPPDPAKPLIFDRDSKTLKPLPAGDNGLNIFDNACTGRNRTVFSSILYEAIREKAAGQLPIAAVPCLQPGAIPLQIQNATEWIKNGCPEGFLCQNNTINSLPQYCPPLVECQEARVAGKVCRFQGKNIGMGRLEPVICDAGHYCPKSKNGQELIPCPAGTYCQPGASTPTPCSVGSRCPKGSTFEQLLIPIGVLLAVDVLIIIGLVVLKLRNSRSKKNQPGGVRAFRASMAKYKVLDDEADQEAIELNATFVPNYDGWYGPEWHGSQGIFDTYGAQTLLDAAQQSQTELNPQLQAFVDSMRKATDVSKFGLSFGYEKLRFQPKRTRPILQNVSGSISRGNLVAVMGGSGAGKSTFVNVLMGKTAHTGGQVTINGSPGKIARYKKLIGFVPQDDIVLPELTVFENILHSARIRLPRTWSSADIRAHVDCVIDCLELSHVRDSLVGSVSKPVISGGQRKRVSIGMELAAAPMAIFLDEPTSGLDATAAASIMRTLKALAKLGISVIVIIHQPRVEIFDMLDSLILLGNGQTIYEGPRADAHQYFEGAGFMFPEHSNHGDVITDIITGNGRPYKKAGDVSKEALISYWSTRQKPNRASVNFEGSASPMQNILKLRGAPKYKQLWLCLSRAMLQQYRAKGAFFAEMGLAALAGFLLGLAENSKNGVLFMSLYAHPFEVLSVATDFKSAPELSLLVAIAIGLVSAAPGVKNFSEELLLYRRESEAGHSRIAYFIAKVIAVLPRMILACFHFTTLLLILSVPVIPWIISFLGNLLYFYCIYGLASVLSMIVRREDAPLFATMISLIAGILSGAAPPLSKVKTWHMEWLWRMSPGTWLAELYFGRLVEPFRYVYNVELAARATGFHLNFIFRNMVVLLGIGTLYRILAFLGLVFGTRLRR